MKIFFLFLLATNYLFAYTVYEDPHGTIKPSQIINYQDKFYKAKTETTKIYDSTVWLQFPFENETDEKQEKYILFASSLLDSVDMYYYENNILIESKNGLLVPIKQRKIESSHFIFKISLDARTSKDIFIRINSYNNKTFSNSVFDSYEELVNVTHNQEIIFVFLSGIVFIVVFIMLFIYLSNKENIYIKYLFYVLFGYTLILFHSSYMQYILYNKYYNLYTFMTADLLFISVFIFFNAILNLKYTLPIFYKYFNFMILIYFILLILEPFSINMAYIIRNLYIVPLSLVSILFILVFASFKGIVTARFLLVGWLFYIFGAISIMLQVYGIYSSPYSLTILQLMLVMDILVFSSMLLYLLKLSIDDKLQKEILLEKQSKYVSIGETLSNIEHQWRTPLAEISSNITVLESQIEFDGMPSKQSLQTSLSDINSTLAYMTQLVDDFKNFYKEDKDIKQFHINFALSSALKLLAYDCKKHNIQIDQDIKDDYTILGNVNDLIQVFLNILGNAKDVFIQRKIKNPYILISIDKIDEKIVITLQDNAGGIEEKSIDIIFEQFYSLKNSTGIGLYISKQIVEKKMKGSLEVENLEDGVCFTIVI